MLSGTRKDISGGTDMSSSVQTKSGRIKGIEMSGYTVYKGIPYAQAPIGKLRWKRPEPVEWWSGEYHADMFRNMCPQTLPDPETPWGAGYCKEFYSEPEFIPPMSEDCLYLNIWVPDEAKEGSDLPVAFYIHGGGFCGGFGSEKEFDGEAYCRKGVILVTVNYRTGIFGFFAHPWLDLENEQGISGNYGILDQIAALTWVYENIAAFGGNPSNITVFGQSAGSMSTQVLISSPLSKGMIAKAILQSGISCMDHLLYTPTLKEEEKIGEDFVQITGASSLNELREMSWEQLMEGKDKLDRSNFMKLNDPLVLVPNVDGYVLDKTVREVWKEAKMAAIPTMAGCTLDDLGTTPQNVQRGEFGPLLEECIRWSVVCDKTHHLPAYIYGFAHPLPGDEWGAHSFHSSELWYMMGTLGRCWRPMGPEDYELSEEMVTAWTDFMKTGRPSGVWEPYTEQNPYIKVFR